METLNTGTLLLREANRLWEQMNTEDENMNPTVYWRMVEEQDHDPEWLAIDKILPRTSYGTNEVDMMKWVIFTQRLRLAWIKKWKARQYE